jgi:N-terminal 7TM region of histidine kinase
VILVGVLAPWLANAVYLLGLGPLPNLDLTPFAFSLTGLALGWGLLRLRLLDAFVGLIPTARDAVVERMRDGVVVLDRHAISSI